MLVHQVFLKVLSLSPAEWAHFSTGRVFNLVTSDVETLQLLSQSIMNLISSPLRIIVSIPALGFPVILVNWGCGDCWVGVLVPEHC